MSNVESRIPEMKLWSIQGNSQRLDGGAMFGNAPRAMWEKWIAPDTENRIPLACRALLVEGLNGRTVLFETGIGAFFEPKLRERYGVVESRHGEPARLLFPNATYVVGEECWQRALDPHPRDRASFIQELQPLLEKSGRLERVQGARSPTLGMQVRFIYSNGHTPGLMLSEITPEDGAGGVVFCADLIPGRPWVHLPVTMGYDRNPELLIDEKKAFLEDKLARDVRLFFTHDTGCAVARVTRDAKGRFSTTDERAELIGEAA